MVNPLNTLTSDDKLWAGLGYVGIICCLVGSVVVFFLKKDESTFIKFNALQAIGYGLIWIICGILLNFATLAASHIPLIGFIFALVAQVLIPLAFFGYWIFLIIQAFRGVEVRIPVMAEFIDKNLMA